LGFSSFSELEESSLEKSKSLRAAHTQNLLLGVVSDEVGVVALVTGVIPVGVVVLVGGIEILPLGIVSDEVSGVAALEAAPG
jgi:hypothetical protein